MSCSRVSLLLRALQVLGVVLSSCRSSPGTAVPVPSAKMSATPVPPRQEVSARPSVPSVRSAEPARAEATGAAPTSRSTDWCIEGLDSLDEETCFVLPKSRPTTLLIYLHGIVPPEKTSAIKTNLQTVVASGAQRANVAALLPRGLRGLAPRGHEQWWGWPTTEPAYLRHRSALVQSFDEKRKKLEARAGLQFTRVYLAGSSSGAYFVCLLALHGGMVADGFAALSGGAGRKTAELAGLTPVPFYIGFGEHDSVAASARALAETLRTAGWPVRIGAHPVGHGARPIYLTEAFEFWREHSARPRP